MRLVGLGQLENWVKNQSHIAMNGIQSTFAQGSILRVLRMLVASEMHYSLCLNNFHLFVVTDVYVPIVAVAQRRKLIEHVTSQRIITVEVQFFILKPTDNDSGQDSINSYKICGQVYVDG
jgi:hypothetical protein